MNKAKVCVVLPSPVSYSETFLQAHVDRLGAAVSFLQAFPIDVEQTFPNHTSSDGTEKLKRQVRVWLHRLVLNPRKKQSLQELFKTKRINVVLAEYGQTGAAVVKLCDELNIPFIVHFHGSDAYSREIVENFRNAYKRMFDHAKAIVAVSHDMVAQLIRLGAPKEKVIYNPYGVETQKLTQANIATAPLRVLSVGRFVEKKAPYLTILAFKRVLERIPEATLVMVGAGLLQDVCRQLIKALHIENAVELKGPLDHKEVVRLMQQSRVFVQHSLVPLSGDTEGTPVAILEAGAVGLPVVSTKHAGINDVVVHGRTGFLVEEGNIDGMSEYMYQLLTDTRLASEMGKNARAHISANFCMDRSIEKLRHVIEQSMTQSSAMFPDRNDRQNSTVASKERSATSID